MDEEQDHADSHRLVRLAEKMHDKGYRDTYVEAHSRQFLARQMREFRGEMSQTDFAPAIGKKQTVVSRLEDPSYAGWSLRTIFEIARKLGIAAFVRFVDFQTFLKYSDDMSHGALCPQPYNANSVDAFALWQASARYTQEVQPIGFWMNAAITTSAYPGAVTVNQTQNTPDQYVFVPAHLIADLRAEISQLRQQALSGVASPIYQGRGAFLQ